MDRAKRLDQGPKGLHDIVKENVDTLTTAFEFCGFVSEGWNRKGTIDWHVECIEALGGDWMKFYKYKTAAFFAAAMEMQTPPSPLASTTRSSDLPNIVLGGKADRWARTLKKKDPQRWTELAVSILYAKKGMARPTPAMVKEAVRKAYDKLTRPSEPVKLIESWADVDENDDTNAENVERLLLETQLRRTTRELLQNKPFHLSNATGLAMPSTSAVYTKTVSKGGMIGELLSNPAVLALLKELPLVLIGVELTEEGLQRVDEVELRLAYQQLTALCWRLAEAENDHAKFVGLPEALKVRVITTGPPYRNFVLKQLQRHLWRAVHECPATTLVGETISEEYLCKQLGQLREGEEYTSVDYSDATNEIHGWVSEVIIEEAGTCIGLSPTQTRIARENLTGHTFVNPSDKKEHKKQARGQLMGSILSFPVLCIANLAICRSAQERDRGRALSLMTKGTAGPAFCVNGDDAVLRGKSSHRHWLAISAAAGLTPSPGKVYQSKKFLNMNSTHYNVCEPYEKAGVPPRVSTRIVLAPNGMVTTEMSVSGAVDPQILFLKRTLYVNLGLLKGYKRSEIKASVADVGLSDSIGAVARFLVDESPARCREAILKKYLNTHWKKLTKTSIPWFLPEHLGGLGIPRPESNIGQKNLANDMRLAAAIYRKPLPRRTSPKEWMMMDIATKAMEDRGIKPHIIIGGDPETQYGLRSLFIMQSLLKARGLHRLFKPQEDEEEQEKKKWNDYVKRVEKALRAARKLMSKVEPFQPDKLPNKPLYEETYLTEKPVASQPEQRHRSVYTLPPPDAS